MAIGITDLAGVVYSAGKVFDGLSTGRLDTANFLRSGSLDGITSRRDLDLLRDLRDAAQYVIDNAGNPIDASFVRGVNRQMSRSGAIHPGEFRTASQGIGVSTRYGRHTPDALTSAGLQHIVDTALSGHDVHENALDLFVELAKAQPFEDGNKRTALLAANGMLIGFGADTLLTIPVDERDSGVAEEFNDLLARAYRFDEHDGVKGLLRSRGFTTIGG